MSPDHYVAHATKRMTELDGTPLAPFGRRLAALAIDMFLIVLLTMIAAIAFAKGGEKAHWISPDARIDLQFDFKNWYSLAIFVVYFGLSTWATNGFTAGKRLLRIRVVSTLHPTMRLWHSLERALGYGASALEFGFGFMQYFIADNRQTTHDRIAGTIVVVQPGATAVAANPAP
jgi:uncharacterized RDD family membrane protein YckC